MPAIKHAFLESEKFFGEKFDLCVDLDVTSPLRSIDDVKKSISKFISAKADVLFSVCEAKKTPYFNMVEFKNKQIKLVKKYKKFNPVRRQDAPKVYEMNASIYIFKRKFLLNNDQNLFTKKTSVYLMPQNRSIDIDNNFDFNLVKLLVEKNDKKIFR